MNRVAIGVSNRPDLNRPVKTLNCIRRQLRPDCQFVVALNSWGSSSFPTNSGRPRIKQGTSE